MRTFVQPAKLDRIHLRLLMCVWVQLQLCLPCQLSSIHIATREGEIKFDFEGISEHDFPCFQCLVHASRVLCGYWAWNSQVAQQDTLQQQFVQIQDQVSGVSQEIQACVHQMVRLSLDDCLDCPQFSVIHDTCNHSFL